MFPLLWAGGYSIIIEKLKRAVIDGAMASVVDLPEIPSGPLALLVSSEDSMVDTSSTEHSKSG